MARRALSTGFIAEEFPKGFAEKAPAGEAAATVAVVAASIDYLLNERKRGISGQRRPNAVRFKRERVVMLDGEAVPLTVEDGEGGIVAAFGSGERVAVASAWKPGEPVWTGMVGGRVLAMQVRPVPNGVRLSGAGVAAIARVYTRREAELAALMPEKVAAGAGQALLCRIKPL